MLIEISDFGKLPGIKIAHENIISQGLLYSQGFQYQLFSFTLRVLRINSYKYLFNKTKNQSQMDLLILTISVNTGLPTAVILALMFLLYGPKS